VVDDAALSATDVIVVRWPDEEAEVRRLARLRLPRLLLVDADADPPDASDILQDWVRLPGDDRDVRARLSALRRRAAKVEHRPTVDAHGRLHFRGAWTRLSPIDERLARALIEGFDGVVTERQLLTQGWPEELSSSSRLRVHLHHLRRKVRPLGLEVRTVRGEGWVLQVAPPE
jgi:two-component system, OmpR family, response regulator